MGCRRPGSLMYVRVRACYVHSAQQQQLFEPYVNTWQRALSRTLTRRGELLQDGNARRGRVINLKLS
jgi:hypothetical protein